MNRPHALLIALALGGAAVLGVFAVSRTVALGPEPAAASDAAIAARTKQLDRAEARLNVLRRKRPPALPALPAVSAPAAAAAAAPGAVVQAPTVLAAARGDDDFGEHEDDGDDGEHEDDGGHVDDD